jgi:hypothetical protein
VTASTAVRRSTLIHDGGLIDRGRRFTFVDGCWRGLSRRNIAEDCHSEQREVVNVDCRV